jgi:hypothetical protein
MLKYFTEDELKCPSSGEVKLAEGFGEKLDELRSALGYPMQLNSACRSDSHVEWLITRGYPAAKHSFHLINNPKYGTDTCAVDVHIPNNRYRFLLMELAIKDQWTIGVAKSFLHLDRRVDYISTNPVVYVY